MRVTCLYIFCACNLAVVLWVSKRPCSVAGRTVVRQRRATDEFRRRVDSPTGALLSRHIVRSQNQCYFQVIHQASPVWLRPVGSVMGEPTSWTSPGHPFLAHVPGQIANRERHITCPRMLHGAGSVLLRCWLESCSSANPVSRLRSTPTGRDGKYVLATTGVRLEGGGRRYSM